MSIYTIPPIIDPLTSAMWLIAGNTYDSTGTDGLPIVISVDATNGPSSVLANFSLILSGISIPITLPTPMIANDVLTFTFGLTSQQTLYAHTGTYSIIAAWPTTPVTTTTIIDKALLTVY